MVQSINTVHLLVVQRCLHIRRHRLGWAHRQAQLIHLHLLQLLVHQLGIHWQWLIQVLLGAWGSPPRKRHLITWKATRSLKHLIASITVLDHTEGLSMLAALVCRRLGHRLCVALAIALRPARRLVCNSCCQLLVRHQSIELVRQGSRVVQVTDEGSWLLHGLEVAHVQLAQVDRLVAGCCGLGYASGQHSHPL